MPRLVHKPPKYSKHKASGQAVVTIAGTDVYLGPYGSKESREAYDRAVAEWLAAGRTAQKSARALATGDGLSIATLILHFWRHARAYYRDTDGRTAGEAFNYKDALKPVLKLYGRTHAKAFGPLALKTVREEMSASGTSAQYAHIADVAREVYEQIGSANGGTLIKTGIPAIDQALGGIGLGETMVVGARPSMGKSTIGRQMTVCSAAFHGTPTLIVSNEESRHKIVRNLLAHFARIENNKLRRGGLTGAEFDQVADGVACLSNYPVFIIDRAFRMNTVRSAVTLVVAKHGVKQVVFDYLQKIQCRGESRYEQVTSASMEVTNLVKELNVAGIVMAQLNRDVTHRDNKRPSMADLRESGQIEQDADQILFLHREDYYRKTGESTEGPIMDGVAELICAKVRDGVRGDTIKLKSNLKYQWFDDIEPEDPFTSSSSEAA